jgi:hypothetical protein
VGITLLVARYLRVNADGLISGRSVGGFQYGYNLYHQAVSVNARLICTAKTKRYRRNIVKHPCLQCCTRALRVHTTD